MFGCSALIFKIPSSFSQVQQVLLERIKWNEIQVQIRICIYFRREKIHFASVIGAVPAPILRASNRFCCFKGCSSNYHTYNIM
jgi:hypothetical protein